MKDFLGTYSITHSSSQMLFSIHLQLSVSSDLLQGGISSPLCSCGSLIANGLPVVHSPQSRLQLCNLSTASDWSCLTLAFSTALWIKLTFPTRLTKFTYGQALLTPTLLFPSLHCLEPLPQAHLPSPTHVN